MNGEIVLELQDENDDLRALLRSLRTKVKGCADDLRGANRNDLQEILADTVEVLDKALQDIDGVL
jgi:hypothetical protein